MKNPHDLDSRIVLVDLLGRHLDPEEHNGEFGAAERRAVVGLLAEFRALLEGLAAGVDVPLSGPGTLWSGCEACGQPIYRHIAWSHAGGTPPQDHEAEPSEERWVER